MNLRPEFKIWIFKIGCLTISLQYTTGVTSPTEASIAAPLLKCLKLNQQLCETIPIIQTETLSEPEYISVAVCKDLAASQFDFS